MNKTAIINLSTEKYRKGQDRLSMSLVGNTTADIFMFKSEEEIGAPLHRDNSHGFKVTAFEHVRALGYTKVLWLDASMYVIKDLQPIFDQIEQDGYFWQDSGWPNSRWTNDRARGYFGTDEGTMMSTGVVGLDFDSPLACEFFDRWAKAMRDGIFHGDQRNFRSDQSCASLIAHLLKMKLTENNTFWQYGNINETAMNDNILIKAHGII